MTRDLRQKLVFHGAIVVIIGLLAGLPYALVRTGSMVGEPRAWSMAHLQGLLNGLILLAVAGVARRLVLGARQHAVLVWSLVGMAYGNVVAAILAALFGVRGLEPAGPPANLVVYALFLVAVIGVLVGMGLVAYGARPGTNGEVTQVTVKVDAGPASASDADVATGSPEGEEPDARRGRAARRRRRSRR